MPPRHEEVPAASLVLDDVLWVHNDKMVYIKDILRADGFMLLVTSGGTFTVHPENAIRKVG